MKKSSKTVCICAVICLLAFCAFQFYGREIGAALGPEWDRVRIGEVVYYRTELPGAGFAQRGKFLGRLKNGQDTANMRAYRVKDLDDRFLYCLWGWEGDEYAAGLSCYTDEMGSGPTMRLETPDGSSLTVAREYGEGLLTMPLAASAGTFADGDDWLYRMVFGVSVINKPPLPVTVYADHVSVNGQHFVGVSDKAYASFLAWVETQFAYCFS